MAVLCLPKIISLSDEGIIILRLKISVPSTILSFLTGILTVVLFVLAVKVAVMGVEV